MNERYLRVNEVCERLSLSRTQLYKLMSTGELPYVLVGKRKRIPESAVVAYVTLPDSAA